MSKITTRIRGEKWTIREERIPRRVWGNCNYTKRLIRLQPNQKSKGHLDTLIHELGHAIDPDATEKEVRCFAKVLSGCIWKDGWRRWQK